MAESSKCLIEAYIDLLRAMECPICYEYGSSIDTPMKLCPEGHLVCGLCAKKVIKCPFCQKQFSATRTRIFDQIREAMIYPCRKVGCGVMVPLKDLSAHEQSCNFREEEPRDYKKNTVLAHNIYKHIEDNLSSFYAKPQNELGELGLCMSCLALIDENLTTTAALNQDNLSHNSANDKSKDGKSKNHLPVFLPTIGATQPVINKKEDLAPSTSQAHEGAGSLTLQCKAGEVGTGGVDTVDWNPSDKHREEMKSADVLACKHIWPLFKCLLGNHMVKDNC